MKLCSVLMFVVGATACSTDPVPTTNTNQDAGRDAAKGPDADVVIAVDRQQVVDVVTPDVTVRDVPAMDVIVRDVPLMTDVGVADGSVLCASLAARNARCDGGTFNTDSCLQNERCTTSLMRPEALTNYQSCLTGRACGVSDDTCIATAEGMFGTVSTTFQMNCLARHTACNTMGMSFRDDYCGTYGVFTDAVRMRWAACLTRPCNEINDCYSMITASGGCR
jgi:hypothetical protein